MERKAASTTVAVTGAQVRGALSRAIALASDEEKVLRMRYGVEGDSLHAPLPRAAGGNEELADELLLIELQLLRAHRAQQARLAPAAKAGTRNVAKEKIVRALRKKH
ncbi:MAG: hypothetical protein HYZ28_06350 [Myxococcales bacterium]|nr:hypothetical protein [Myxococcales bacterium]